MIQLLNKRSALSQQVDHAVNQDEKFTVTAKKKKDVRETLAVAWAGTGNIPGEPCLDWALSHVDFSSPEERIQMVRFCISYILFEDWRANSFQLCGKADHDDGSIVSVASVQQYDPNKKGPLKKFRIQSALFVDTIRLLKELPPMVRNKDQREDMNLFKKKCEPAFQQNDDWR